MTRCVGMASRLCIMTMTTTTTISMTRYRKDKGEGGGRKREIKDDISLRYVGIKGNVSPFFSWLYYNESNASNNNCIVTKGSIIKYNNNKIRSTSAV